VAPLALRPATQPPPSRLLRGPEPPCSGDSNDRCGIHEHIRAVVSNGQLVAVKGKLQRDHGVCNIIAAHLEVWS
jgi:hypothetical protein